MRYLEISKVKLLLDRLTNLWSTWCQTDISLLCWLFNTLNIPKSVLVTKIKPWLVCSDIALINLMSGRWPIALVTIQYSELTLISPSHRYVIFATKLRQHWVWFTVTDASPSGLKYSHSNCFVSNDDVPATENPKFMVKSHKWWWYNIAQDVKIPHYRWTRTMALLFLLSDTEQRKTVLSSSRCEVKKSRVFNNYFNQECQPLMTHKWRSEKEVND